MTITLRSQITKEMVQRMVVDVVAVNIAVLAAVTLRFWGTLWLRADEVSRSVSVDLYNSSIDAFVHGAILLTPLSLIVFALSGFYTRGRAYRGRYKALIIFQAVTLTYIVFGTITYLFFNLTNGFPRSVWLMGWLLTLAFIGGLRLWGNMWRATVWTEAKKHGRPVKKAIRNVLVMGGAGYVGSVLVRKLLNRGYNVTVMDALMYGDDSIGDLYEHPHFELIRGDLRNIETVIRSLQYADAVVHLGGLVGDPACEMDEKLTMEINLAANHLVAEAARGLGVQRFVFASTCSVYGASDEVLDEHSILKPVSLYAKTKMDSETAILKLADERFAPVVLRFGTFYGISPRPRFDLVVNLLTAKAVKEGLITVHGGDQWRPFIHVDDGSEAIVKTLEAPVDTVGGQIFNVGSDEQNHTIAEIASMIQKLIPRADVVRETGPGVVANYKVSCEKIRKRLGFEPAHTVQDGILEIKAALEALKIPDYLEVRYSNQRTLTEGEPVIDLREGVLSSLFGSRRS